MEEIWIEINESDLYELSNYGNVRNKYTKVLKSFSYTKNGAYKVYCINGKPYLCHRLVAKYFVDNPNPKLYNIVNHLDENTHNNKFDNLEWTTNRDNLSYSNVFERNSLRLSKSKVIQYDKNGNIIKVWNSLESIYRSGFHTVKSSFCKKAFNRFYYNSYWFYENEEFDANRIKYKDIIVLYDKNNDKVFDGSIPKAANFLQIDKQKLFRYIRKYRTIIDITNQVYCGYTIKIEKEFY